MTTALDKVNGHAVAEPRFDPVELAEAAAIRARTEAETEARLTLARAEAKAIETKAAEEAEKQRILNVRQRMALEEKQAAHDKKMAAEQEELEEIERRRVAARKQDEAAQRAAQATAAEVAAADSKWRGYALGFYIVCAIVALPVQVAAFWSPSAPWLIVAPLMLEGGAWVVLKGAAAAVAGHRPHWHYRLIAWCLAFIAASINLWHGIHAFDIATAVGTAFASVAGPGVWDLHEHGRIRKRDGVLTRSERKAQERAAKRAADEKAASEKQARAEREAKEQAAKAAADQLAADREKHFPKVWDHAIKLAADLGETSVTEAIWKRAKRNIEGTDPGDSVDIIRGRNMAERRVLAARSEAPGSTPVKASSSQLVPQVPARGKRGRAGGPPVRGVRRKGDTTFSPGARRQQSITARTAASEEQS